MNRIFLGEPPARIKQWIIDHAGPDLSKPLCFTAIDAGATIALNCKGTNLKSATFQTSTSGEDGSWTDYTYATNIALANAGDKVYFKAKADNTSIERHTSNYLQFTTTQNEKLVNVSGNIMSLLAPEFKDLKDLSTISSGNPGTYEFSNLFYNCKNIKNCKDLMLPATTLAGGCYYSMFKNCTSLIQPPALPATTLAIICYYDMFSGCTSLTSAPELPATTLAEGCYNYMFTGCTSLTQAPSVLPATTLATSCYYRMFQNCTSLTSAPELPATTLAGGCYNSMFYGCTSLTSAPELPATTLAEGCYNSMFYGCTSLIQAPALPATTLADYCYAYMFENCESLQQASTINALDNTNYRMFYGCNNLHEMEVNMRVDDLKGIVKDCGISVPAKQLVVIKCLDGYLILNDNDNSSGESSTYFDQPNALCFTAQQKNSSVKFKVAYGKYQTSTDAKNWYDYKSKTEIQLNNVGDKVYFKAKTKNDKCSSSSNYSQFTITGLIAASGNIQSLLDQTCQRMDVPSSCYCDMFSGCTSLTSAPELPATTLAEGCYNYMFTGCTSLTQAPSVLPATTLANYCYYNMFNGCTSLTQAPALPATTLDYGCYYGMFADCTALTQAPELPAETLARYCYAYMFSGCTSLTSAPELPATTLPERCYTYMFTGCTSLTQAPALPATTLATECYSYMFQGCDKLSSVETNNIKWIAGIDMATDNWLDGVSLTGTFVCPASLPQNRGASYIPDGWTIITK